MSGTTACEDAMNITVNGQQYDDWASVPADVRQTLAQTLPDMNNNGVPDLFEQPPGAAGSSTVSSVMVNVNGQTYTSADQMPPEMQEMLRQALGGLAGLVGSPAAAPQPGSDGAVPQDHVLLNGVPTPVEPPPRKKRWWQRG